MYGKPILSVMVFIALVIAPAVSPAPVAVAPPIPTNLSASDGTFTDRIHLEWSGSSVVTYYEVYRATSSTGSRTHLGHASSAQYDDTSAAVDKKYWYWVNACDAANVCSKLSSYDTGLRATTPKPTTPTGLKASDGAYIDRVALQWNAVSGIDYYEVYRATSATGSRTHLGHASSATYDDTSCSTGKTYTYWVNACLNSGVCSALSRSDTGRLASKPAVPTSLAASDAAFVDRVSLTWAAVTGAAYYEVYRATSATGSKNHLAHASGPTYDDKSCTAGKTYTYWVNACTSTDACSSLSTADTGSRAVATTKPAVPTGLTASDGTDIPLKLQWAAITGADYYEVYRAESATGTKTHLAHAPGPSYEDGSVSTGKTYTYWINACTSANLCSALSAPDTGFTPNCDLTTPEPLAPEDTAISSTTTIQFSWRPVEGAYRYKLEIGAEEGGPEIGDSTVDGTSTTVELPAGYSYRWSVQAISYPVCYYNSPPSTIRELTVATGPLPPLSPQNVNASDGLYQDYILISWNTTSRTTSYDVFRAEVTAGQDPPTSPLASVTGAWEYEDHSPTPGVTYYYWVRACNADGCGNLSAADAGNTGACQTVGIPSLLAPENGSTKEVTNEDSSVTFEWADVPDVNSYEFKLVNENTGETVPDETPEDGSGRWIWELPGAVYSWSVRAQNPVGNCPAGEWSETWQFTLTYMPPPGPPTNVLATDGTYSNIIRVTWESPDPDAEDYNLYRAESPTGEKVWAAHWIGDLFYNDSDVIAGKTYYYWVAACVYTRGCSDFAPPDSGYTSASGTVGP